MPYPDNAIGKRPPNSCSLSRKIQELRLTNALRRAGFQLYREWEDKEWGIIDCISFIVMRERGLVAALTADRHFSQAGFRVLLKEDGP